MSKNGKKYHYSDKDKKALLNLLVTTDFDIKNAVINFNKATGHNLSRATVYAWIENDEKFSVSYDIYRKDLIKESEQAHRLLRVGIPILDEEDDSLIAWVEKPDRAAIEFFLKNKASDEYTEKKEVQLNITEDLDYSKLSDSALEEITNQIDANKD